MPLSVHTCPVLHTNAAVAAAGIVGVCAVRLQVDCVPYVAVIDHVHMLLLRSIAGHQPAARRVDKMQGQLQTRCCAAHAVVGAVATILATRFIAKAATTALDEASTQEDSATLLSAPAEDVDPPQ
jgi:hypothetical protein